jgi:hypothetical protein
MPHAGAPLIQPVGPDMQTALDGALHASVEFSVTNAVPPVLLEDIFPSFVTYDGVSSVFNFSKDTLTFNLSPVIYGSEGSYSLLVRNPAGYSNATVYLDVQSKLQSSSCMNLDDTIMH